MKIEKNYRPATIEFTATSKQVPASLGKFNTEDEARLFMAANLITLQTKLTAVRKIDATEKQMLREQYTEELEQELPMYRNAHSDAAMNLEKAKQEKKQAEEMVNASLTKIQQLADEVNGGITHMDLDPAHTWQANYAGKDYFYTWMDGEIKLAGISESLDNDLLSSSERNADFFEKAMKTSKKQVG